MKELLNCPNCGAPIDSDICPYCGSVFLDWTAYDMTKPTFVKVKGASGKYILLKLGAANISYKETYETLYCDNLTTDRYVINPCRDITLEAEFRCYTFRDPITRQLVNCIIIDPEKADEESVKKIINCVKK